MNPKHFGQMAGAVSSSGAPARGMLVAEMVEISGA
jgi:hypothetical protein